MRLRGVGIGARVGTASDSDDVANSAYEGDSSDGEGREDAGQQDWYSAYSTSVISVGCVQCQSAQSTAIVDDIRIQGKPYSVG